MKCFPITFICTGFFFLLFFSRPVQSQVPDNMSPEKLAAWCIVPFDAKKRTPTQRAEMLKRLGIKRCAYDWRGEHVMEFEEEITANFSMEAFTSYHGRRTRIMGSHGDINGDMTEFTHTDFLTGKINKWNISIEQEKNSRYHLSGHGGGDWGLVTDWIKAVKNQDQSLLSSTIDASVESHIMGFMAEKSRETNQKIQVHLK